MAPLMVLDMWQGAREDQAGLMRGFYEAIGPCKDDKLKIESITKVVCTAMHGNSAVQDNLCIGACLLQAPADAKMELLTKKSGKTEEGKPIEVTETMKSNLSFDTPKELPVSMADSATSMK